MSVVGKTDWHKLPVTLGELCINTTLRCGQSFRWQKINHEWQDLHFAWSTSSLETGLNSSTLSGHLSSTQTFEASTQQHRGSPKALFQPGY
ncbi:hypothetical protein LB505_005558 [Fusarium chuoi]|nr:hypothetical protein LB505_005558 [Fusarium chuoi]